MWLARPYSTWMTTPREHERRVERLFDGVWNGDDPDVANELVARDYVVHDRDLAEELCGPGLYRALARGTREILDRFADGLLVETRAQSDVLGLARQIGALPSAGNSGSG